MCEPVPGQSLVLARMGADGGVACIEVGNTVTFVVAADGESRHLGGVVIDVPADRYVVAVPGDMIQESGLGIGWPAFPVGKGGMARMTCIQVMRAHVGITMTCIHLSRPPPVSLILKAFQLSQTEPVTLVPEAVLHAETPPRYRYFHVDVLKKGDKGLVLRFNVTTNDAFVVQVTEGSCMSVWNARCAHMFFPEDQLLPGDQVVQVNKVIDTREFEKEMMRDDRTFMVVRRRLPKF